MKEVPPFLLVTIDTECDKTPTWHAAAPLAFRAVVEAIPKLLQPLFADFGIRPTYLLSPEVITHPESLSVLRETTDCELAAHLHGDYLLPEMKSGTLAGSRTSDMQCEYPPELERSKLEVLTELFIQQLGWRPESFRAGRFGLGRHTGRILHDLGYSIDSSVTPHIRWTDSQGRMRPDYRRARETPYTVGPAGDIFKPGRGDFLELPITIVAAGALRGDRSERPVWFRPSHSDVETLLAIMDHVLGQLAQDGVQRPLVMMFHNVELLPGASPYVQTETDAARYVDSLKRVFDHAEARDVRSCTMSEYHRAYMEGRTTRGAHRPGQSHSPAVWLQPVARWRRRSRG